MKRIDPNACATCLMTPCVCQMRQDVIDAARDFGDALRAANRQRYDRGPLWPGRWWFRTAAMVVGWTVMSAAWGTVQPVDVIAGCVIGMLLVVAGLVWSDNERER